MDDILTQMDEAFDKLWEECECSKKKHPSVVVMPSLENSPIGTTNVKGNIARRALNSASNDKKVSMAKKAIEPSKGE